MIYYTDHAFINFNALVIKFIKYHVSGTNLTMASVQLSRRGPSSFQIDLTVISSQINVVFGSLICLETLGSHDFIQCYSLGLHARSLFSRASRLMDTRELPWPSLLSSQGQQPPQPFTEMTGIFYWSRERTTPPHSYVSKSLKDFLKAGSQVHL